MYIVAHFICYIAHLLLLICFNEYWYVTHIPSEFLQILSPQVKTAKEIIYLVRFPQTWSLVMVDNFCARKQNVSCFVISQLHAAVSIQQELSWTPSGPRSWLLRFPPWLSPFQQFTRRYFWWLTELEMPPPGLLHTAFKFYTTVNECCECFSASHLH